MHTLLYKEIARLHCTERPVPRTTTTAPENVSPPPVVGRFSYCYTHRGGPRGAVYRSDPAAPIWMPWCMATSPRRSCRMARYLTELPDGSTDTALGSHMYDVMVRRDGNNAGLQRSAIPTPPTRGKRRWLVALRARA